MEAHEKELRTQALEIALEDIDKIIKNMEQNNYSKKELNEYYIKRWNTLNELYKVKKS